MYLGGLRPPSDLTEDFDILLPRNDPELVAVLKQAGSDVGLPENWLDLRMNNYKMEIHEDHIIEVLYNSPSLVVLGASAEYLLAMKIQAARGKDAKDIRSLIEAMGLKNADQVEAIHGRFFPALRLDPWERKRLERWMRSFVPQSADRSR